jgi:hypothetical protein
MFFVAVICVLVVAVIGIWSVILLRPAASPPQAAAAPAPAPFVGFPTIPTNPSSVVWGFMVNKSATIRPNTLVCGRIEDLLAFWNPYMAAYAQDNDSERHALLNAALAASCKITTGTTIVEVVSDNPTDDVSADDQLAVREAGSDNTEWVEAASVDP